MALQKDRGTASQNAEMAVKRASECPAAADAAPFQKGNDMG
jgi:hypothetical protein